MKQKMLVLVTVLMGIVTIVSGQEQRDYVSPAIGTLKYVPAGRFQRDDTAGNISVISNPYRISQHEITRVQFASIMGSDPSWDDYSSGTTDPVQNVNWYHAIAFCNKLSLSEGLDPVYEVDGVDYTVLTFDQIPMDYKKTGTMSPATGKQTAIVCPPRQNGCGRRWEPLLTVRGRG